jgi:hypothetical protein
MEPLVFHYTQSPAAKDQYFAQRYAEVVEAPEPDPVCWNCNVSLLELRSGSHHERLDGRRSIG